MAKDFVKFDEFPTYKGGNTRQHGGYVWEFLPGHHLQNNWGFVAQHRLVAEDMIERPLEKGEVVHHKDQCRWNNDPSNLQVMTQAAHRSLHGKLNGERLRAHLTEDMVVDALKGRSIQDAARHLHLDKQTLRNRYPELIRPRQRQQGKAPCQPNDPKIIEMVKVLAPDPTIGYREASELLRCSGKTIQNICLRNKIEWHHKKPAWQKTRPLYRGKTTQSWLELHGFLPEPESQPQPHPAETSQEQNPASESATLA